MEIEWHAPQQSLCTPVNFLKYFLRSTKLRQQSRRYIHMLPRVTYLDTLYFNESFIPTYNIIEMIKESRLALKD